MSRQPSPHLLPLMHCCMIQHEMDGRPGCWDLSLQLGKKGDEPHLAFTQVGSCINSPGARIKRCEQVQGTHPLVLVLQTNWLAWSSRQRRGLTWTRLQVGLFVNAYDHFPFSQGAYIELNQFLDLSCKVLITGHFAREPQMVPPWFEFGDCKIRRMVSAEIEDTSPSALSLRASS